MNKRAKWHFLNNMVSKKKVISFVNAGPSVEVVGKYFNIIKKDIEKIVDKNGPEIFNYAQTKGDLKLRKALVKSGLAGENSDEEMVIVTNGGQESIKIIVETILKKGEKIMTERLSYIGLEQIVLDNSGEVVCFSNRLNNLKLTEIEKELRKIKPKILYLVPDFSNPCGDMIKSNIRKLLVNLSKELSFWIIEDQTYKELYYKDEVREKSMFSKGDRIIIVGSVSKTVVPGLRIGWMVVKDNKLREKLTQIKESFSLSTNNLSQRVLSFIFEKKYQKTILWVRNYYAKKMEKTLRLLKKMMPNGFKWREVKGGFYIWIEGPKDFNAEKTLKRAMNNGVAFTPGELFYYDKKEKNTFRLSISAIGENEIEEGIYRLTQTLKGKVFSEREVKESLAFNDKFKKIILRWHRRR